MKARPNSISIEELASGKLPDRIHKSIGNLRLTLQELSKWRTTQAPIYVAFRDGHLIIDLRLRWSLKKIIAIAGGAITILWALVKILLEVWPIITK